MAEQRPENEVMAIYQHLQCSVCKEFYTPPIYICKSGHNFCNNCQSNRQRCRECYRDRTSIQNLTLERLITTILLPCPNAQFGCDQRMSLSERENHVIDCNFAPFMCPIDHCFKRMGSNTIVDHLKDAHNIRQVSVEETPDEGSLKWETTLNGYQGNWRACIIINDSLGMFIFRELQTSRDNILYVCQTLSQIDCKNLRYILHLAECGPGGKEFIFRGTPQPLNKSPAELMESGNYLVVNGRLNEVQLTLTIERRDLISSPPPENED